MINIKFFKKNEYIVGLEVKGHAGYAVSGKDIVCASISSITQMTVSGIVDELKLRHSLKVSDGYLKFILDDDDLSNDKAQFILTTCLNSLKQIIKDYSKYVNLEVKENV